jgi:alkylated DNA repair protein (DNA oxidative demethylase)
MGDLFPEHRSQVPLAPGEVLLGGFALAVDRELLAEIETIAHAAPFRHLETPSDRRMSVAMTNVVNARQLSVVQERRPACRRETDAVEL